MFENLVFAGVWLFFSFMFLMLALAVHLGGVSTASRQPGTSTFWPLFAGFMLVPPHLLVFVLVNLSPSFARGWLIAVNVALVSAVSFMIVTYWLLVQLLSQSIQRQQFTLRLLDKYKNYAHLYLPDAEPKGVEVSDATTQNAVT